MKSDVINIAVVGAGYWGPNLIRNLAGMSGNCRLLKICDRSQERLDHMKSLYPAVEMVTSLDDVLEDDRVDAVAIATPLSTHYEIAKKALTAGKHCFVEKPLAGTSAQCQDLIDIAEQNKLILMVGYTFIYSAPVRYMEELISSGDLGEIYYISSRRLNLGLFQQDINVAWDLAPHDLSIINYLLKSHPVGVNCQGKCHTGNGIEDITNMTLDFDGDRFATVQSSWLDPNKIREMTIVGSQGMVVYDDTAPNEKIKIYDKRVQHPPHYDTYAEFVFSYHYGDMRAPFIRQTEPLKVEMQHFMECIRTGSKPLSDGLEGLRVVQILEAANESMRNNGAQISLQEQAAVDV